MIRRTRRGRLGPCALAMVFAGVCTTATAAPPTTTERGFTDGVDRPVRDVAGAGDASSLELNPALLGAVDGLDLVVRGYLRADEFSRGAGVGGWLSAQVLGLLTLGMGVQRITPGFGNDRPDFAAADNPPLTKLSFGVALGNAERIALGLGVHGAAVGGDWLTRPDVDVGLLARITNYGAIGARYRDSGGRIDDQPIPPQQTLLSEIAIRPLGTDMLELAGGVDTVFGGDDGSTTVLGRGRAIFRWEGVSLSGELAQVRTTTLDPATLAPIGSGKTLRGSIALGLSWDMLTSEVGVHAGVGDAVDGVGIMKRIHSQRDGRLVWSRPVDVERVALGDVTDERAFIALLERLERARAAGPRAILLIDTRDISAGWSTLLELRNKLIEVRGAGGHVFAYSEFGDLRDVYMASVAQQVFVHPAGELAPFGIATASFYYRSALERIGVQVEALHVDEFKSAHEPYTRTDRSEEDAMQRNALLDDIYGQVVADIAQGRGLTLTRVRELIDDAPYGTDEAIARGLADTATYRDEILDNIAEAVGMNVEFMPPPRTDRARTTWSTAPYVATVLIEGTITDGESISSPLLGIHNTGAETITRTLRALREDKACRGIILRVNSPGGSALASDLIWREVDLTRQAHERDQRKPPIVVSMGDVAASGGYYVAAGTRHIFASPTTITGSIGVVALHFDVAGMLEKLDIKRDAIVRGINADISRYQPWTEDQRARLQQSILRTYELFLRRVAQARDMDRDAVHALARGRVYSGEDALEVGLVDALGGLDAARDRLDSLMAKRPLERPELRVLPAPRTVRDVLVASALPGWLQPVVTQQRIKRANAETSQRPPWIERLAVTLPLQVVTLFDGRPATILPGHYTLR